MLILFNRNGSAEKFGDGDEQCTILHSRFEISDVIIEKHPLGSAWSISVPVSSVERLYWRHDKCGILISDNPQLLRTTDSCVDHCAVHSVLQFGAAIPPATIWTNIKRFTPGLMHCIKPEANSVDAVGGNWYRCEDSSDAPTLRAQNCTNIDRVDHFSDLLCHILTERHDGETSIVLFSGGVDSGLIAALMSNASKNRTVLVNYAFGVRDEESILAEQMANHLGLQFVRIMNNADIEWTCLRSPLLRYPEPFSDYSLLSSYSLASAVINRYDSNCNILDGTGADGLFGLFDKATNWRKLLILPRIIFFMASIAYEISGCSMRPGWLEERLRPLRRAWQLPYPAAALAQNPHNGIFYSSPAETTRHVCESLMTWCSNILQSADRHLVLPLMDVALICCNVFVPKMKHHFNRACFPVLYPFLDSRVVDFALHDVHPSEERESKGLLKKLLGRMVPHSMVYRPKSGFIPPLQERFAHPEMLERVAALAEESSPMRAYVNFGALQQAITALGQKRALPSQTYNSLWGLIFLDAWLRDAESIPVPRARHC